MSELLLTLFAVMATGFDYQTTTRRMARFGLEAELNPLTKWLAGKLSVKVGVAISLAGPLLVLIPLFLAQNWDLALAFYAGMKGQMAWAQIMSYELEKRIAEEMGLPPADGGRPPSDGDSK